MHRVGQGLCYFLHLSHARVTLNLSLFLFRFLHVDTVGLPSSGKTRNGGLVEAIAHGSAFT